MEVFQEVEELWTGNTNNIISLIVSHLKLKWELVILAHSTLANLLAWVQVEDHGRLVAFQEEEFRDPSYLGN